MSHRLWQFIPADDYVLVIFFYLSHAPLDFVPVALEPDARQHLLIILVKRNAVLLCAFAIV